MMFQPRILRRRSRGEKPVAPAELSSWRLPSNQLVISGNRQKRHRMAIWETSCQFKSPP